MKKQGSWRLLGITKSLVLCSLIMSGASAQEMIAPSVAWNTFIGASDDTLNTAIFAIVVDSAGNSYVTGSANGTWGTPIDAYAGGFNDAFVAKFSPLGALLWHTFIGSAESEGGRSIAIDNAGNVYVAGNARGTWGSPPQSNLGFGDGFVQKLSSTGARVWNTYIGTQFSDSGASGVAVDNAGSVYVTGGYQVGGERIFVVKLNATNGNRSWFKSLGNSYSVGHGIAADSAGNSYVAGTTYSNFGTPIVGYSGDGSDDEVVVAKLDTNSNLQWNTYFPANNGRAVELDSSGAVFIGGGAIESWGNPKSPASGDYDGYVQKLSNAGQRVWNTFIGGLYPGSGDGEDTVNGISFAADGSVIAGGSSSTEFGKPQNTLNGSADLFAARLDRNGHLRCNAYFGSSSYDQGFAVAVDSADNILLAGASYASWGSAPEMAYTGPQDGALVKFSMPCPKADTQFYVIPLKNGKTVAFDL